MKEKILLWLDDYRDPIHYPEWLNFSPIERPFKVIWVKNYLEFVEYITENGLPEAICFDHDLREEHYDPSMYGIDMSDYNSLYEKFSEGTGRDAAKWLCSFCKSYSLPLPAWNVHSANPVGKQNIINVLNDFKKQIADGK